VACHIVTFLLSKSHNDILAASGLWKNWKIYCLLDDVSQCIHKTFVAQPHVGKKSFIFVLETHSWFLFPI
jgi:hypothetical protein